MVVVVFPCAYLMPGADVGGRVENVWDSVVMVQNSKGLQIILTAFFFTVSRHTITDTETEASRQTPQSPLDSCACLACESDSLVAVL